MSTATAILQPWDISLHPSFGGDRDHHEICVQTQLSFIKRGPLSLVIASKSVSPGAEHRAGCLFLGGAGPGFVKRRGSLDDAGSATLHPVITGRSFTCPSFSHTPCLPRTGTPVPTSPGGRDHTGLAGNTCSSYRDLAVPVLLQNPTQRPILQKPMLQYPILRASFSHPVDSSRIPGDTA